MHIGIGICTCTVMFLALRNGLVVSLVAGEDSPHRLGSNQLLCLANYARLDLDCPDLFLKFVFNT